MARLEPNRSSKKTREHSRQNGVASKPEKAERKALIDFIENYQTGSDAQLAKAAGVAPSTISMILRGMRKPSAKIALRLAKALSPPGELDTFSKQMLTLAGHMPNLTVHEVSESIVERSVLRRERIRAGYILSPPFVDPPDRDGGEPEHGFAIELFKYIANLIGVDYELRPYELRDLNEILERGKCDIVVSAVLQTFQRSRFMAFSKPFPYLRIPLSGIIRTGTMVRDDIPLSLEHVLHWTERRSQGLGKIRLLLIEGEVGDEFVGTFLPGVRHFQSDDKAQTLNPGELYKKFTEEGFDLLLADLATCVAVQEEDVRAKKPILKPLPQDTTLILPGAIGHKQFPTLALYPITFGLPKGDEKWKTVVDDALASMMSEGIRPLLALYEKHLEAPHEGFPDFIVPYDELVPSKRVDDIFKALFRKFGLYREDDKLNAIYKIVSSIHERPIPNREEQTNA
jgi:transcriptional regulator with XRE-family HTH domain